MEVKQDKRAVKYHQRRLRNGEVSKCKQVALDDMKVSDRKYIVKEYLIMRARQYDFTYIPIN